MLDLTCATPQFIARFWAKVDRRGPNDCWPWNACVDRKGYGKFSLRRGINTAAHRVAYALTYGIVPDGACVCHSCDNPLCCNPAHLWLGTVFENNTDMITKGRFRIARHDGIHNPRARLTEFDVYSIRTRVQNGETRAAIAREYGVSYSTIDHAVRGISWKHLK